MCFIYVTHEHVLLNVNKVSLSFMIYLCCYISLRRPSDVGSTVTNHSCTLLIGHTETKSVYIINSLHAGVL